MATMSHKRRRAVSFTNVEIVELPYTLGDNPSVSCGVPISASWTSQKRTSMDLEFFERYRPPRRDKRALYLTKEARIKLMLQNGHTQSEIDFASEQAMKTRQERFETIREMKQKLKAFMARETSHLDTGNGEISSSSPMPLFRSQQLPSSPIIPRKSPVQAGQKCDEKFPYLQFPPCARSGVTSSPRFHRRKRSAPIDVGDDLFHEEDALTPDIHNSSPKRLRSPRNRNEDLVLASRRDIDLECSTSHLPAREKSPRADCRPPIAPRRFASPPPHPSMLLQRSPQHPRTM